MTVTELLWREINSVRRRGPSANTAVIVVAGAEDMIGVLLVDDHAIFRSSLRLGSSGRADSWLFQSNAAASAAGERYVDPEPGAQLVVADGMPALDPLSDRNSDALHLLALGHTNQEIGKKLFISVPDIDTHRAHIITRNCSSRPAPNSFFSPGKRTDRAHHDPRAGCLGETQKSANPLEPTAPPRRN